MKKIGWVLVGASTIAKEWMVDAIRAAGGEILSVVSGDTARGADFAVAHGIPASFTKLDEALAQPGVNAVYISTTNQRHLPQTLAAAQAGKHVLCEKPLALALADAQAMVAACSQAGVRLGTNHHLRNAVAHHAIRQLVRDGAIGRPRYVRVFHAVQLPAHLQGWRVNSAQAGGGVVLDISVHDADTLRFILDDEAVKVVAMTSGGAAGLEQGVMASIQFGNGVLAQIHDAFDAPYAPTGLEVHGSTGSIIATGVMGQRAGGEVRVRDADGERVVPLAHENLYQRAVSNFHAAIRGEGQPSASGIDGVRSLELALAIQQSAQTGQAVAVRQEAV
ncbi:MAG: Gfo/Idh/MocA family oxidoreductase [Pseudomonadota bacterium]